MGLSYGREKFQAATLTLVSSLPLRERINNAVSNFLVYLIDEDLPSEAVQEFNHLLKRVTGLEEKLDEGLSFRISSLSNYQLEAIAERIVALHIVLCEAYEMKKTLNHFY